MTNQFRNGCKGRKFRRASAKCKSQMRSRSSIIAGPRPSTQGKRTKHGKPQGVVSDDQPEARERQAGRPGGAGRVVVPRKPGNAGGGKGLSSRQTQYVVKDLEIGQPINSNKCSEAADGVARASVKSCPRAGCGKSACPVR